MAESISFVTNLVNVTINRFQFIVSTRVCIFGKSLLSYLFMVTEYWDAKLVTNCKNPFGCHKSSLTLLFVNNSKSISFNKKNFPMNYKGLSKENITNVCAKLSSY